MKKVLTVLFTGLFFLASFAQAQVKESFGVKPGEEKGVVIGSMLVKVANNNIGCGTYSLVDAATREIKGSGGISDFRTSLSISEFNGQTLMLSCRFSAISKKNSKPELVPVSYVEVLE